MNNDPEMGKVTPVVTPDRYASLSLISGDTQYRESNSQLVLSAERSRVDSKDNQSVDQLWHIFRGIIRDLHPVSRNPSHTTGQTQSGRLRRHLLHLQSIVQL